MAKQQINPAQILFIPQRSVVNTIQTTTSTSFVSLATVQSVTVTIGPSGNCLIGISAGVGSNPSGAYVLISYSASGANTITATDDIGAYWRTTYTTTGGENSLARTSLLTGLTPGSTTFTMRFRTTGNTGNFERREIWVLPL